MPLPLAVLVPLLAPFVQAVQHETVAGGEVTLVPLDQRDDGVPLPIGPRFEARDEGDVLLDGPSGDPYVLGFAAGAYRPAEEERVDPELAARLATLDVSARPGGEAYAFVMFAARMTPERVEALEAAGARVLGFHPHYTLKVALRPEALDAVASLSFVRWVGTPKRWQRVHPYFEREAARYAGEPAEVIVNVYDSDLGPDSTAEPVGARAHEVDAGVVTERGDEQSPLRWQSNGWQQRALVEAGLEVESYVDAEGLFAFRGRLDPARLDAVLDLDFVQFVEPVFESAPMHEETMPMTNADRNRVSWDGSTNSAAIVGIVDSGIDIQHTALNHILTVGWDLTNNAASDGPFHDVCEHGSHVAGTVLGDPISTYDGYTGAAPGLGWGSTGRVFTVKLWHSCASFSVDMQALMDLVDNTYTDGFGNTTPRPHLVTNSWGSANPGPYWGTEFDARQIDLNVFVDKQQQIFSAGNLGSDGQTLTLQSSAKNALGVGNVNTFLNATAGYPGNLWSSSSRGPTADLRWGPSLCAPGVSVNSVDANTSTSFTTKSGTSMAAPHVTGIAAQLVDEHPFLRYNPATLSAVLMAGTITKDSTLLSVPSTSSSSHLNMYGTGRIDATKARGGNSQQATYFWGFTQDDTGYGQVEFPVNAGATQVTVVMNYKEISASSGASSALVNDLDLWIDPEPFSVGGPSGDYSAQQSTRDNSEVRVINNPAVGTWRLKVYPDNVPSGFFDNSDVGLCAIVTYGDVTPDTSLTLTNTGGFLQPDEEAGVTATVACPSYYASAVYLESNAFGNVVTEAEVTLADGIVTDLIGNNSDGREVLLGDILGGTSRQVRWKTRWASEGIKTFSVTASADNMDGGADSAFQTFVVDGTAPAGPTHLSSSTHPVGVATCSNQLGLSWTPATDALAGLEGYLGLLDAIPNSVPLLGALNVSASSTTAGITVNPGTWYFHLRARDKSGNWGVTQHYGPIVVQPGALSNYCVASPNSTGLAAKIAGLGPLSQAQNAFQLRATQLPPGQACVFIYAPGQAQVPFGNGFLCLSGSVKRLPGLPTGAGVATFTLDFTNPLLGGDIPPGKTYHFQNWYRDPAGGGAFFNLSDGLTATFCP